MKNDLLSLLAGIAGGIVGFFAFTWIARHGFYALILPGALVGLGATMAKGNAGWLAIACGVLGLAFGLFSEWRFAPFVADQSLPYFLTHIQRLSPVTLIMIALGAFFAFWAPFQRSRQNRMGQRSRPS
jgi:hypothetical protein